LTACRNSVWQSNRDHRQANLKKTSDRKMDKLIPVKTTNQGAGQQMSALCASMQPTGNDSVPIQMAQCWFAGLPVSNAKTMAYFSNKIYGSNFIKQHSETVTV